MQITKNKTAFTRFTAMLIAAFMATIVFAFNVVKLNTNATDTVELVNEITNTAVETITVDGVEIPVVTEADALANTGSDFEIVQLGAAGGGAGGGGTSLDSNTEGDAQFMAVVNFFVKWIKRIGLLVAFIGGIMFALAIKNNDADRKETGLMTLVAGFAAAALCQAIDMFGIFN